MHAINSYHDLFHFSLLNHFLRCIAIQNKQSSKINEIFVCVSFVFILVWDFTRATALYCIQTQLCIVQIDCHSKIWWFTGYYANANVQAHFGDILSRAQSWRETKINRSTTSSTRNHQYFKGVHWNRNKREKKKTMTTRSEIRSIEWETIAQLAT